MTLYLKKYPAWIMRKKTPFVMKVRTRIIRSLQVRVVLSSNLLPGEGPMRRPGDPAGWDNS